MLCTRVCFDAAQHGRNRMIYIFACNSWHFRQKRRFRANDNEEMKINNQQGSLPTTVLQHVRVHLYCYNALGRDVSIK